jgi:hypothetical protein
MNRIKIISSAVLALGLSISIPTFAGAAQRHVESHTSSARVAQHAQPGAQSHAESRASTRVEFRAPAHVERRVETSHDRVVVDRRPIVERERVVRDIHVDRDYRYDRGIRFGVGIAPVYPVYPSYPVYANNDCDIALSLSDVPACVLDTAGHEIGGAIESVRLIRQNGLEYYRVIVDGRDGAYEVHVSPAGGLISVGRC